jgi:hypothetical protein
MINVVKSLDSVHVGLYNENAHVFMVTDKYWKWPTELWHLQAKMTGKNFQVSQTLAVMLILDKFCLYLHKTKNLVW